MKDINNEVVKNIRELGQYMIDDARVGYLCNSIGSKEFSQVKNCVELLNEACDLIEEYTRVLDDQNRKLDAILVKLGDKA